MASRFRLDGDHPDAVLMLHGWTGSPAHFRLAADFLHGHSYTVLVPRLEGHGTSVHDMAGTGWKDWVESALEAFLELAGSHDRVHVVGLSMGGIIGLLLAATNPVASITTINAPQRLHAKRARMARLMRGSRRIHRREPRPVPRGDAAQYWIQYESSPLGTVSDLLDLIDAAGRALPLIRAPAVVIQSRGDETVHPESAGILYAGLGSLEKRIVWLERSRHVALLDDERDLIHSAILGQLEHSGMGRDGDQ